MRLINKFFSLFRINNVEKIKIDNINSNDKNKNKDIFSELHIIPNQTTNMSDLTSHSNINSIIDDHINVTIICNIDFKIIEVSDNFLCLTNFTKNDLIGQFIGIIMNDLMAHLHKNIFMQTILNANVFEQKKILDRLHGHSRRREIIIYDKFKKDHYVDMSIKMTTNNNFTIDIDYNMSNTKNINLYTLDVTIDKNLFIKSRNDIIIMNIDFIDSTLISSKKGVEHMIAINKLFYLDIVNLIVNNYYPYIYIHEIIGDSFILVMNIDWGYTINELCATIAIDFLSKLSDITSSYIKFKVGITYGKLHYGYIDHNIRFFGDEMNMSSRLHGKCKSDEVIVQKVFFDKLKSEIDISKLIYLEASYDLKGLGMVECIKLKIEGANIITF